ncbi:oxidoreductase, short-chain dehydrogenase/reductase family protein [Enhygromyxa salina]|uniref:Oxidoreductase, short-chain dehydrogenase/reductase family protein n=1 Tax=Enhygromyxa salina TaxID=215803 RepID=A0A0C2CWS1_9BACT|nr:SDR family NAD(P)-dependent oxidoreductase [Enhygromyxa salina]KIG14070.1 oxidoreductase, short-chain dehydrogenase/reductase family protein [Enhygromyxa salina]
MPIDLHQRKVLLTGASGGLGVHVARALAGAGAHLILTARDADKLSELAAACERAGAQVSVIAADLANPDDRARLIESAGEIDVLINNAGVEYTRRLLDQSDAQVHDQIALNLAVPIDLTRRVLPPMLARKRGTIVNISSMSGKGATPYNSVYAATKHGLNGFTTSLGLELHGTGVHVGVVCPGFVSEGMWGRTGIRAPLALREVRPQKVAAGVMKVLRGAKQVLVTEGPVRPLLALVELFPGIEAPMLRMTNIVRTLERRADALDAAQD